MNVAVGDPPFENAADMGPADAANISLAGDVISSGEIRLTIVIFVFALIAMVVFYLLVRSGKSTPYLMRIYVVIILVFGTLLVVSSAYATEQIAPVVGLFGTIAGYLLGKSERREPPG
jgi:hydrogenase/urease accessory protein HupE